MRVPLLVGIAALATLLGCRPKTPPPSAVSTPPAGPAQPVRVAAVQFYSELGNVNANRSALGTLVEDAARQGAQIVVLPECAVAGYYDPKAERAWSLQPEGTNTLLVAKVAEAIPGMSTEFFGGLARRLSIYLVVGLIEREAGRFYNAQILLDPNGQIVARHRKAVLWPPGDGPWATQGDSLPQVADTPYGRIGLMISHEIQYLAPRLKEQHVDLVLYSTAWYGPNPDTMFTKVYPRRYFVPNGFAIAIANWAADPKIIDWPGHGASCVIGRDGRVLAVAKTQTGGEVVVGDVP